MNPYFENKLFSSIRSNDQAVLAPYGPTWEDDGFEDAEARKIASARKRLLSYKSDKLKQKTEESMFPETYTPTPPAPSVLPVSYPSKTDIGPCKIPFVPTPDEIKEHPIFSNFSSSHSSNDDSVDSVQVCIKCILLRSENIDDILFYS